MIKIVVVYLLCAIELWIGQAATSYFAFLALLILMTISKKIRISRFALLEVPIMVLVNYFVVIIGNLDFIKNIVTSMGKNLTFSGRIYIWADALKAISKKSIFGYGVSENLYYITYKNTVMEGHNYLLSNALQGGVILVLLYLAFGLYAGYQFGKYDSIINDYVVAGIVAYDVMFLTESPACIPGFWGLLALSVLSGIKRKGDVDYKWGKRLAVQ